jgi:hypothetical protein
MELTKFWTMSIVRYSKKKHNVSDFFSIDIVGGGVLLGPLGTAATNRPIVPAPGDYDDGEIGGMMIGNGNRSTRRKRATTQLCPPQTPHTCLDANPGRRGGKSATNRLSYGMVIQRFRNCTCF